MYKLLIEKIKQNKKISEEEKLRRYENVMTFWRKEGDRFIRLIEDIKKEDDEQGNLSFDNSLLGLGFWLRFMLLCEGEEPTYENVLNGLDFHALNLFVTEINGMVGNKYPPCGD